MPAQVKRCFRNLEGTSLPVGGNSTHAVLTAHSDFPAARLFTDLNRLHRGDKFYIHNIKETLAYQVETVEPGAFTKLFIVPGHDYCTLLTCTPIMINSHRLLVRGHRVQYVPEVEEEIMQENRTAFWYRWMFYGAIFVIGILLDVLRRKKQEEK